MVLCIKRADGSTLQGSEAVAGGAAAVPYDNVGPIPMIGKTFFKNVQVRIGGQVIYDANSLYPYKAFFETELNYGQDAKETHLQACLYYRDEDGKHNIRTNAGFLTRSRYFRNSALVELMAPLHVDLFEQDRCLLNLMDVQIDLDRAEDKFVIMCPGEPAAAVNQYKMEVKAMSFLVRKLELEKDCVKAIDNHLLTPCSARYPIRRVKMTTVHIGRGSYAAPTTALFTGQLPRRVLVACTNAQAFQGDYTLNPFCFDHYNIKSAKLVAGGQSFPEPPYTFKMGSGEYLRAYLGLFDALGVERDNRGNGISRAAFANGFTILGFDLTPDSDDGPQWQKIKDGSFTKQIEFAEPIPPPGITLIIYAEYDNLITIDHNRMPSADYIIG
jgi:hypothetical protein